MVAIINKYIFIPEPGKVMVKDAELPKLSEGEALLKVLYGGICGSDLSTYRGISPYVSYPRMPGHELSAEIAEIPPNDYGLEKGMCVTVNPYFNCKSCYSCNCGHVNCCTSNQTMGVQREGGFANYIAMPIERIYNGKGLSPKELALAEPFAVSTHAVKRTNIQPGQRVLVVGAGTIGILAMIAAKRLGAVVTICDIAEKKLDYAKRLGADIVFKNGENFLDRVNEITECDGFDVTIEAVGLPQTFQNCVDAAAFFGKVVLIGISKLNLDFNFSMIQKKELAIYGARNALREDFQDVIDIIPQIFGDGGFSIDDIVTNVYPLERALAAFDDFDRGTSDMLKVMIKF